MNESNDRPQDITPVAPVAVELFTHPICSGCHEALNALRKLEHREIIVLTICSLATHAGRLRAEELGVTTVPTVRQGDRFDVLERKTDLEQLIKILEPTSIYEYDNPLNPSPAN